MGREFNGKIVMILRKYGPWRIESKKYDNKEAWYLMLSKDASRTPQVIDYPIIYDDKKVGYCHPEQLPNGLKAIIQAKALTGKFFSFSPSEKLDKSFSDEDAAEKNIRRFGIIPNIPRNYHL